MPWVHYQVHANSEYCWRAQCAGQKLSNCLRWCSFVWGRLARNSSTGISGILHLCCMNHVIKFTHAVLGKQPEEGVEWCLPQASVLHAVGRAHMLISEKLCCSVQDRHYDSGGSIACSISKGSKKGLQRWADSSCKTRTQATQLPAALLSKGKLPNINLRCRKTVMHVILASSLLRVRSWR
jgi:hypothetical protein